MPDPGREFLLRVHSSPEGHEATVQRAITGWDDLPDDTIIGVIGPEFTGQGATEVAACLAALSQAKLGEAVDGHDSPRSPDAV